MSGMCIEITEFAQEGNSLILVLVLLVDTRHDDTVMGLIDLLGSAEWVLRNEEKLSRSKLKAHKE
jgi:hypothetical protein